jgi:PAS domain S-box-containing protein
LHNAIEYGGVPVLITNKNGLVNYTSISFEKILRKRLEEIYNVYLPDILQKYLTKTEYEELDDAIKKGREWVKIISFVSENSGIKIREVKLNPIYRNSTFSKNFILTANDITNYILKNKIIKKSEERQRTIINNISDPLIIIRQEESQFYVENVNDSFIKTFEKAKDTIIEKSMYQVFPKSLQDIISESIYEIEVGKIAKVKFRYKHELSEKVFAGKLTYVDNSYDKFRIYIITLSDITERLNHEEKLKKALEKENQLNKLKTSFLTNMSHEIRTPLNAISGYSTLLEEDIKDGFYDSVTELAGALKEGVERLLGLVDNIVEASLLESGTDSYSFKDICLNDLLFKIYNDFKKKEYPKNLDFYFESEKEELYLNADESKLEKIISLILDNSTKYNVEKGQIFIRLRSTAKSIFIEIEDTGIGIEENKIKQILEPFSQAEDDGYTRRHEGAGLGLTIAYKLTKEFKGDLDINSRVGEGTTIILRFPKVTLS